MLNGLVVLAIVLAAQNPIPRDWGQQQEHSQTHSDQRNSIYPLAESPPELANDKKGTAAKRYAYYKTETEEYLKASVAPAYLSNWVLAALGIVGGIFAGFTLGTIKRQVAIQSAAMQQWIDVETRGVDVGERSRLRFASSSRRSTIPPMF
jgi:hypothetical protein